MPLLSLAPRVRTGKDISGFADGNEIATKVICKHQGYEETLSGVDESLNKFGFGNTL